MHWFNTHEVTVPSTLSPPAEGAVKIMQKHKASMAAYYYAVPMYRATALGMTNAFRDRFSGQHCQSQSYPKQIMPSYKCRTQTQTTMC